MQVLGPTADLSNQREHGAQETDAASWRTTAIEGELTAWTGEWGAGHT